jgi:hypothetical protein
MILFILDGTTNLILKEQQKFYKIHALLAKMCVHTKGKKIDRSGISPNRFLHPKTILIALGHLDPYFRQATT